MKNEPYTEFVRLVDALNKLLKDPQPGFISWVDAVQETTQGVVINAKRLGMDV